MVILQTLLQHKILPPLYTHYLHITDSDSSDRTQYWIQAGRAGYGCRIQAQVCRKVALIFLRQAGAHL